MTASGCSWRVVSLTIHVVALQADGVGDVTETSVVWRTTSARCYVPSPVVLDGYLLVADDRGTANCFDAATGERYWQARLGKGFSASLIHAGGLAYFTAEDGETVVIRPSRDVEIVARNPLGEYVSASPAVSDGTLYLRGEDSLFAIRGTAKAADVERDDNAVGADTACRFHHVSDEPSGRALGKTWPRCGPTWAASVTPTETKLAAGS